MNVVYTRVSDEIRDPTKNLIASQRTLGRTLLPSIGFGTFRDIYSRFKKSIVRPTHRWKALPKGYSDLESYPNSQYYYMWPKFNCIILAH